MRNARPVILETPKACASTPTDNDIYECVVIKSVVFKSVCIVEALTDIENCYAVQLATPIKHLAQGRKVECP